MRKGVDEENRRVGSGREGGWRFVGLGGKKGCGFGWGRINVGFGEGGSTWDLVREKVNGIDGG